MLPRYAMIDTMLPIACYAVATLRHTLLRAIFTPSFFRYAATLRLQLRYTLRC